MVNLPLADAAAQPLAETLPAPHCEVCVIVPVRDEAANLPAMLRALAQQVDLLGNPLCHARYEIVLLANNCRDDSAAIAHRFALDHPTFALHVVEITLPPHEAHVGRARQLLMDDARRRLMFINRPHGLLASTDADSCVAPTWIAAMLHERALGADAIGGRIMTSRAGRARWNAGTRVYYLRDVGYQYLVAELGAYLDPDPADPWPRHYQHTGASFAVTAQKYAQAGGLPPLRSGEDVALRDALVRIDARVRHSPLVRVQTSARQAGRARGGMADQLHAWAEQASQHRPQCVEPLAAWETRWGARQLTRRLWQAARLDDPKPQAVAALADTLGLPQQWLDAELAAAPPFGQLWQRVEQAQPTDYWRRRWPLVDIRVAIADMRIRLADLRHARRSAALQQIEPVARFATPVQMVQVGGAPLDARFVHLVAGERIIIDKWRPVHEQ